MDAIIDLVDKWLDIDLDAVDARVIGDNEQRLTDLNRDQLDKGLDAEGKSLGQYANLKYKGRRRPVDLLQTGAFRGDFGYDTETGGFIPTSADEKTPLLEANYSDRIVGLPEDKYDVLGEILQEAYIKEFRDAV